MWLLGSEVATGQSTAMRAKQQLYHVRAGSQNVLESLTLSTSSDVSTASSEGLSAESARSVYPRGSKCGRLVLLELERGMSDDRDKLGTERPSEVRCSVLCSKRPLFIPIVARRTMVWISVCWRSGLER